MSLNSKSSGHFSPRLDLEGGTISSLTLYNYTRQLSSHSTEESPKTSKKTDLQRSDAFRIPSTKNTKRATAPHQTERKPVIGLGISGIDDVLAGAHQSKAIPIVDAAGKPFSAKSITKKSPDSFSFTSSAEESRLERAAPSSSSKVREPGRSKSQRSRKPHHLKSAKDSVHSSRSRSNSAGEDSEGDLWGIRGAPDGGYSRRFPGQHSRFMEKFAELNGMRK